MIEDLNISCIGRTVVFKGYNAKIIGYNSQFVLINYYEDGIPILVKREDLEWW